ncbi:MAG: hypothetical protein KJ065_09420 [Anaerolineae bacterium]|nr:hypothetical protein [Anaerolineae bacterium]
MPRGNLAFIAFHTPQVLWSVNTPITVKVDGCLDAPIAQRNRFCLLGFQAFLFGCGRLDFGCQQQQLVKLVGFELK